MDWKGRRGKRRDFNQGSDLTCATGTEKRHEKFQRKILTLCF